MNVDVILGFCEPAIGRPVIVQVTLGRHEHPVPFCTFDMPLREITREGDHLLFTARGDTRLARTLVDPADVIAIESMQDLDTHRPGNYA